MNKREALKVLIEHSFLLSEETKRNILEKMAVFTDEEVEQLGKFLAEEKKKSIETAHENIAQLDQMLEKLAVLSDEETERALKEE